MKLSIITICYNDETGFKKTAQSIIQQTFTSFEWIIVDGASTDGTVDSIKEIVSELSILSPNLEVRWNSGPDKGIYNAMNKGILASHGEYLLFLNSGDSLFDKSVIERVVPLLKDKDIYVGQINSVGKENASEEEQADFSPEGILRKLTFTWIPHQASFFKRTVFDEYGLYREDKRIASDWWAYFNSLVLGNAMIAPLPLIISNYDVGGISATNYSFAVEEQNSLLKEHPLINVYFRFYRDYKEIVEALRSNRFVFLLFRLYFYFYRKFTKK